MADRLRSPITWFGGKGNMAAKILPSLPKCHCYVEPFGGGASILIGREPSPVEVYNDLDSGLVGFFRVLRDPEQFEAFHRLVSLTPYSRQEYYDARATWRDEPDPVKRAALWLVVARQSFSGIFGGSWGVARAASNRGMAMTASTWLSAIDRLPDVSERLLRVQIDQQPALQIISDYDSPDTLFYCDPPYVTHTRSCGSYAHEMTDDDHHALVDALLGIKGMAALSGYPSPLYDRLDAAGWHRTEWQAACYAAGRTRASNLQGAGALLKHQPRTEVLWRNPACVEACRAVEAPKAAKEPDAQTNIFDFIDTSTYGATQ